MRNLKGIFALALGIAVFWWGASLIHHNYTHQRDVLFILKSGKENISAEVTAHHSGEATKELAVHLTLIVFGVLSVFTALWLLRKTHNKADAPDRKNSWDTS